MGTWRRSRRHCWFSCDCRTPCDACSKQCCRFPRNLQQFRNVINFALGKLQRRLNTATQFAHKKSPCNKLSQWSLDRFRNSCNIHAWCLYACNAYTLAALSAVCRFIHCCVVYRQVERKDANLFAVYHLTELLVGSYLRTKRLHLVLTRFFWHIKWTVGRGIGLVDAYQLPYEDTCTNTTHKIFVNTLMVHLFYYWMHVYYANFYVQKLIDINLVDKHLCL